MYNSKPSTFETYTIDKPELISLLAQPEPLNIKIFLTYILLCIVNCFVYNFFDEIETFDYDFGKY